MPVVLGPQSVVVRAALDSAIKNNSFLLTLTMHP